MSLAPDLAAALARFASQPRILVATDYDGVVAPIVAEPDRAFPLPGTVDALTKLATRAGVTVALVSGRDRATLGRLSGAQAPIVTVGSHGAEWQGGFEDALDDAALTLRAAVLEQLAEIAVLFPGATVEPKPLGGALHVRNVAASEGPGPDPGAQALDLARRGPAARPGVHATEGKAVLELTVRDASKGRALTVLRNRTASDAVLYLGDDVTDEKAFVVLAERAVAEDVSVKVGDGATAARFRIARPEDARAVLEAVLAAR